MLNLFDTLSKTLKQVETKDRPIRLYSCGPTVYNHAHIGNLRSFVFSDTIKRVLEANGQKVDWVMNITDVDDKTIKKTVEEFGESASPKELLEFTERYTKIFLNDLKELNIDTEKIRFIKVSEVIPQIQEFITELINKGFAYKADDGSTYFNIEKYQAEFGDYGKLVGEEFLAGKKVGARVAVDEYEKDNLSDFALWKAKHDDDAQIFWDHEVLGQGRPGWHIECSAINKFAFENQTTDIHTGGVDLIFPHHTNEIAQSQPFYKPFSHHWAHSEHLLVEGKKMSKSFGNYLTLGDLQTKSDLAGPALRLLFMQSHYRTQLNFTWQSFESAINAVTRLFKDLSEVSHKANYETGIQSAVITESASFNDDLNTSTLLADTYEKQTHNSHINKIMWSQADKILGLGMDFHLGYLPEDVSKLLDKRYKARENKDFAKSDELRTEIEALGYEVKDTNEGQKVTKK